MIYLVFETLEDAQSALNQIDAKVRDIISSYNPNAIDNEGIIPRNAATGELIPDATRTTTWAIPQQRVDGKWCFPKLLETQHPLFFGVDFLEEVSNYIEEYYQAEWFDVTNNI